MKAKDRIAKRAKKIKVLLMDVDGVLTDGRIYLVPLGEGRVAEAKAFHSLDGGGLKLIRKAGIRTGVITGRRSAVMEQRARELKLDFVCQGTEDKIQALNEVLRKAGVSPGEVAYVGDDLSDLGPMKKVGLPIAVPNAVPQVRQAAMHVTQSSGGQGAVREVVELILRSQGKWKNLVQEMSIERG
jgi:3-deoxy-D-manno-octulosonate 8-phosphate phosphatase (KDO 8-P phosphatase)